MGRFLKRVKLWFGRGRSIEAKVDAMRRSEKAQRIEALNEISRLDMRLDCIEKKLDLRLGDIERELDELISRLGEHLSLDEAGGEKVTAKQLLNEYLYGEHGDE